MKSHPLKGWRKILALIGGGAVCTFFPAAAPILLPLLKLYIPAQAAVDAAEHFGLLKKNGG
jgi:hypothetical protein